MKTLKDVNAYAQRDATLLKPTKSIEDGKSGYWRGFEGKKEALVAVKKVSRCMRRSLENRNGLCAKMQICGAICP